MGAHNGVVPEVANNLLIGESNTQGMDPNSFYKTPISIQAPLRSGYTLARRSRGMRRPAAASDPGLAVKAPKGRGPTEHVKPPLELRFPLISPWFRLALFSLPGLPQP